MVETPRFKEQYRTSLKEAGDDADIQKLQQLLEEIPREKEKWAAEFREISNKGHEETKQLWQEAKEKVIEELDEIRWLKSFLEIDLEPKERKKIEARLESAKAMVGVFRDHMGLLMETLQKYKQEARIPPHEIKKFDELEKMIQGGLEAIKDFDVDVDKILDKVDTHFVE